MKKTNKKIYCPHDNLLISEVGIWAKNKHDYLSRYIEISSRVRKKYLSDINQPNTFKAGATYIDLFCGPGRSKIKHTGEFVNGSAIVAWLASQNSGSPFSHMYISDSDEECLRACETRLKSLGANVTALPMVAAEAVNYLEDNLDKYALHFAFIDPFDIKSLKFDILKKLSNLRRLDILIHMSKMDLQRNLVSNLRKTGGFNSDFDSFIPGWENSIDTNQSLIHIRSQVIQYWTSLLKQVGIETSKDVDWKLITGTRRQPLYWLILVAKHELALNFWKKASNTQKQENLF